MDSKFTRLNVWGAMLDLYQKDTPYEYFTARSSSSVDLEWLGAGSHWQIHSVHSEFHWAIKSVHQSQWWTFWTHNV